MSFSIGKFIADRRDGRPHSRQELFDFSKAAGSGQLPDYQITAWLMAAYLNPLDAEQTAWLTLGMAESGERLDLSSLPKPWVDKHSTGGVGDKTSLVILPVLAACGVTMVKMSGRGLGITGGTLDKLACVPGFRLDLSPQEMLDQAREYGLALTGQSPRLAPADKVFYALRDATETVGSMPLIASSILSKKIAGGAEVIVLDVKCGSGAFMKDLDSARQLKKLMEGVGEVCGLTIRAHITDMDQPLGRAAGNAVEVQEALDILCRRPLSCTSARFKELVCSLAGMTLAAAGKAENSKAGKTQAEQALESGRAEAKARDWFKAQGAASFDVPIDPLEELVISSPADGWAARVDAESVGRAVLMLGGGRQAKDDVIDGQTGVLTDVLVGDHLRAGQPLFRVRVRPNSDKAGVQKLLQDAVTVSSEQVSARPVFLEDEH